MSESKITLDLIYPVLQRIQDDVAHIRRRIDDHDEQFKAIRHLLAAIQSDDTSAWRFLPALSIRLR